MEDEVKDVETTETEQLETEDTSVDTEAFAELISEKDKRIDNLEKEIKSLKRSNAELLVRMSAGQEETKNIEETIINFCDTRKF